MSLDIVQGVILKLKLVHFDWTEPFLKILTKTKQFEKFFYPTNSGLPFIKSCNAVN